MTWLRRTPGRLAVLLAATGALTAVAGTVGAWGAADRTALIDQVTVRNGPVAVAAQELYGSLSDADATVAAAFLAGGLEPVEVRDRYRHHLADASAALATVAGAGLSAGPAASAVADLTAGLPVYAGLVETARAYHRQGLPLGAAYLRESSELLRQQLLPAAQTLFRSLTEELTDARDRAAHFPRFAVAAGALALAALLVTQWRLARRTRRLLNPGLLTATVAGLASLGLLIVSWAAAAEHLETSRADGSAMVELLVEARITALQARTDEALTLVARGNGDHFEASYQGLVAGLTDQPTGLLPRAERLATDPAVRRQVQLARAEADTWQESHRELRRLDDDGDWERAVGRAVGDGATSTAQIAARLDAALGTAIGRSGQRQVAEARTAADRLAGVDVVVTGLAGVALLGTGIGGWLRLREYG